MKILITTDLFTTSTNGVVTSVRNLWEELKDKGHEVRILTLSEGRESYKEGAVYYIKSVSIGFIYPDVRMPISYHNYLIRELIDWKPDVVHSQCEFFTFQYAQRIAKLAEAPLIHTYHTMYDRYVGYVIPSERIGRRMVKQFIRTRMKKVDTIIAPTTKVEDTLQKYGLKNNIQIVPSGISLKQHTHRLTEEERKQKRNALGIPDDNTVLINLGRLGTEKNLGELLQLFAKTLQSEPELTFLIVGDGPDKNNLEKQAEKLGIRKQVIFTGMVKPIEVQDYYQLADFFVSASTSETQGLTYIEAAANGLPLLCKKDECLSDVIREGINGYAYENDTDFQEKLKQMKKDTEWRKNAAIRSMEIAQTFDKSYFGDTMESVYETLLTT